MQRINTPTKAVNMFGAGKHGYTGGNPATNTQATQMSPEALNALQEEIAGIIEWAGIALNSASNTQLLAAIGKMFVRRADTGVIRTITSQSGGAIREFGDVLNAGVVGTIEWGVGFNCPIDAVTGVWGGRDIAGPCWLEKYNDAGTKKEFWFAPSAAAGVVPAWVNVLSMNFLTGLFTGSMSPRVKLSANATFYVASTGDNANDGKSAAAAWQTMQYAYNWIAMNLDLNGYQVVVNVADGAYSAGINGSLPIVGLGSEYMLKFIGNSASPTSCSVTIASGAAFFGGRFSVDGFYISAPGTAGYAIQSSSASSRIYATNIDFGPCTVAHASASAGGVVVLGLNYSISGNAAYHLLCSTNGYLYSSGATCNIPSARAFTYFAATHNGYGCLVASGMTFTGAGVAGTTGQRYLNTYNGFIDTLGGGANYFPGSTAGTSSTGGQYR